MPKKKFAIQSSRRPTGGAHFPTSPFMQSENLHVQSEFLVVI